MIAQITEQRVAGLVYVAALAPDEGETVLEVFGRAEPHEKAPRLAPDGDGWIWLPDEAFADAFAQNASREDQRVLAALQRPTSVSCITVPVGPPLWNCLLYTSDAADEGLGVDLGGRPCLLYTSPSPRDVEESRMPSSA